MTTETHSKPSSPPTDASLVESLYQRLRGLAAQILRRERQGHTLQATALVHEAYLRLAGNENVLQNQQMFFRIAARAMRQILVNHERDRVRLKRGGGMRRVSVDDVDLLHHAGAVDLVVLDDALATLERIDPRKVEVVQLRFFAGLSTAETAKALGLSTAQVKRDWALAKAWLSRELDIDDTE